MIRPIFTCGLLAMAFLFSSGRLLAQDDKEHVVGKGGLALEGKVEDDDPKVKILGGPSLAAKKYMVKLMAGRKYKITMDSDDLDSFLVIQNKAGKQIALDDDSGGALNSLLTLDILEEGSYQVYAASLKGTGAFKLKIVDDGAFKVIDFAADFKEKDGVRGITIKGEVAMDDPKILVSAGPNKVAPLSTKSHFVKLQGGKKYELIMRSKDFDSILAIHDPAGKQVAFDDDSGGDLDSLVVLDVAKDTTYKVFTASLNGTGEFVLTITEKKGDAKKGEKKKKDVSSDLDDRPLRFQSRLSGPMDSISAPVRIRGSVGLRRSFNVGQAF